MNNRCDECVNKSACEECRENPKWANVPKFSKFMTYIPTCPRGYDDCVCDPAYIKYHHPEWYAKLYGDKTPEEASKTGSCQEAFEDDPDEEYYCYDNEDK